MWEQVYGVKYITLPPSVILYIINIYFDEYLHNGSDSSIMASSVWPQQSLQLGNLFHIHLAPVQVAQEQGEYVLTNINLDLYQRYQ